MPGLTDSNSSALFHKNDVIQKTIKDLLVKIDVPYFVTPYDQAFHDLCCKVAIEKGYPMGSDRSVPSLRPFIPSGVIMAAVAYDYIESEAIRVFIALYTAFLVFVDDTYEEDNLHISVFIERFIRSEKQMEPVLDGMARFLQEIPNHYEPVPSSLILTACLNLINASTLEYKTQKMKASLYARDYPSFTRRMSGSSETYTVMVFPPHIPMESYIQCLPDACNFINHLNDVLSFYKEEQAEENVNYISVLARCHDQTKIQAFQQLASDVAKWNENVCKILEGEALESWIKFKAGYVGFHTSFERYRLDELMG